MRIAVVALFAVSLSIASAAGTDADQERTVQNLRAFAKLYGYVRFFHPSDEAGTVDWNRFAAYGAGQVAGCADAKALRLALDELFRPIAPGVQVYGAGAPARVVKLPGDSLTCRPVCWQHRGVGLQAQSVYASWRTSRPIRVDRAGRSVVQSIDLRPGDSASGRKLRVRARARAERVEPGDEPVVFALGASQFDDPMATMARAPSLPVSGKEWREYEVEAALEPGQNQATVGVANGATSVLWADDFEAWVSSGDSWTRLELKDAGFEDSVSLEKSPDWMYLAAAEKSGERPSEGARCLRVVPDTGAAAFAGSPAPGEFVDKPLDLGLGCRIPLCLWSKDGHTLPRADGAALARLKAKVDAVGFDTLADPGLDVRLGDVVIVWNVMQHFYPYFDVVPVDWDTVLTAALSRALTDTNRMDFLLTLRQMGAALSDGHAWVNDPVTRRWGTVPACTEVVEGRVAVTAVGDDAGLRRGDVVLEVNGRPAEELLAEQMSQASGSLHYRRARCALRLLAGPKGDTFRFLVERGVDTVSARGVVVAMPQIYLQPDQGDSIRELAKGIWYVDLNRAPMEAIDSVMNKLSKAKGVVFDMRGYPNGNHDVISHLLTGSEPRGEKWMFIPQIAYPDRERIAGWDGVGWSYLQPKPPHIEGKVVFLTNGLAISYAESFMSHIEGFKLAEIVGGPTAGTNGNVNPIELPGGYRFTWTGMRSAKFDGSQHHLIGIQPTVPLERTLKAVRAGRDEYIEKAIQVIQQ